MKNPLLKDTFREIGKTKGRFFSIFAIITLGVSFFTGIKAASPVMKNTSDKYYDDKNLMDITVLSNLGITDKDVDAISKVKGVENIYPTYSKEVLTNIDSKQLVLKVHGIPSDFSKEGKDIINKVNLVEGRYPKKENECLIESGNDIQIGSKIKIYGDNDEDIKETLKHTEYTVVGKVESPYYIAHDKGTSSIGSGKLNVFMMVLDSNFKLDAYTESFITVAGAKKFNSYDSKYEDYIENTKKAIESIGKKRANLRYEEVISEAREKLEDGKKELEEQTTKAENELNKAYNKLEQARSDLKSGNSELNRNEKEFKNTIKEANEKIKEEETKLLNTEKNLESKYDEFIVNKPNIQSQINEAKEGLKALEAKKSDVESYIANIEQSLKDTNISEDKKAQLEQELTVNKGVLDSLNSQIKTISNTIASQENTFKETEQNLVMALESVKNGKLEIEKQKKNLKIQEENATKEFKKARNKLEQGRIDLEEGQNEYDENKVKVQEELLKAQNDIKDAEKEIDDIKEGKWYVLDRNANYGFVDYKNSTESIAAISKIFPVFFFSIAALICLTTMTRMVDEQRTNIGTMKALGYSTPLIMFKYIMYALIASVGGSILGCLLGFSIFPTVIFDAYTSMTYVLPKASLMIDIKLAIMATLISVLTTTLAVISSCSKELVEVPSLLMRPKAPKEGKRIIIERIPFIWNRLGFIQKVTCRNIFRYKKRFFMTVIGIAGCSALLVTGFGIRDSISSIVNNQYEKIFKYSGTISYKTDIEKNSDNKIEKILKADDRITDIENIKNKSFKVINKDIEKSANIIVPEDSKKLSEFISFNNRKTGKMYTISDNGVLINEKLGKLLNASIGDSIFLENDDKERFEVKVEGIVENYVGHYIYMSDVLYKKLFKEDVKFNQALIKTTNKDVKFEEKLSNDLMKLDDITSAVFNTSSKESFSSMIGNLNTVVILVIVSAGALAFIVLYNLTNVNISERIREIATIKVLGFYDGEVSSYVFRENIILTLIGTLVGLLLGIFLHKFIITTAELDFAMFGREIKLLSFVISGILTMIFAGIVNLCMYYKLKKVKMVESLKSVD